VSRIHALTLIREASRSREAAARVRGSVLGVVT
jgi:hypothetical protein